MSRSLNQLVEHMREAGRTKHAAELFVGAAEFFRATSPTQPAYFIGPLEMELAVALLVDEGPERAARHRTSFVRLGDNDTVVHIGTQPEFSWRITEWRMLLALRLLERDFRPLPRFLGRPTYISAPSRADLRRWTALFVAFSARNAALSAKAISALGRHETKEFSVIAYALYREAERLGIPCPVPPKYDF